ncbi:MAG: glycerol-3-phosphate acyltransferase [Oscillospiraceae bacterium]|nr:glycerol-3-phosphate acyltransferase [Oscillospiraceae bacterium]
MIILKYLVISTVAYLLGSMSMSIMISNTFMHSDVRAHGSGNAGATNMARVYGLGYGALTLLGDALKAALAMLIGWWILGDWGLCVSGCASLLGHCYPILHEFRGGKGVSAGAAVFLAIDWRVLVFALIAFIIGAFGSKKVSLGSILAAVTGFVAALILHVSLPRLILAGFAAVLVILRHRENIVRLINGTEKDFKPGHAAKKAAE